MVSEQEIWKDIPGYECRYQASTLGNIRSLDRWIINKGNSKVVQAPSVFRKGKLLKPFYSPRGYLLIDLGDKTYGVHVLVLSTFDKPRPKDYCCLHGNDIKDDNRFINLRWGTYSENAISALENGLYIPGRTGKHGKENPQSKPVIQMDLNGNVIAEFESMVEAGKCVGTTQGSISSVCRGVTKTAKGFRWSFLKAS